MPDQITLERNPNIGYELISDLVVHDRLYAELCRQTNETIKQNIEQLTNQCEKQLNSIEHDLQQLKNVMISSGHDLNRLASDLRQY